MNIAIYQMEVIPGNVEANHAKVKRWLEEILCKEDYDIVVLPELWTTGYTLPELDNIADVNGEPTTSFLQQLARQYEVAIVGGSFANKVEGHVYNHACVVSKTGDVVYTYDKIHLVPMLKEPAYLTGGKQHAHTFELGGVKMGLIICYDLRFPELTRKLALEGAEVVFIVAQWPLARRNHWIALQTARAIENQLYVVASNSCGSYEATEFSGTSLVIDANGEHIRQGSITEEETITATLQLEQVQQVRRHVPVFSSRMEQYY
ncbi:carbon-nitrogen family hydrolase [Pontibacillus litoralis]|uniref:Nitrilase/cyanide hydratase and apolipoprotein N-acyltransferase n=1 Tax=Pontibacillus litoralis JSM 072002 TaxID=1385512 RepID=A0A0A5G5B1_9BACI|nr:carbon-nitrogen family hydrolase [Pontibacillus litoralis]KGX86343.1 nitrilase/cyanide hydratase and apolipoprotein N-acyltransferase [Pontibacillus litoralis JSM 072002]